MVCGPHPAGTQPVLGAQIISNIANINGRIKNDLVGGPPIASDSFQGLMAGPLAGGGGSLLYVPNRGVLQVFAGDYIGVDSTGWPILISANAMLNGPWTHSGTAP